MAGFFDSLGHIINGITEGGKFYPDSSFSGDVFNSNRTFVGYSSNGSSLMDVASVDSGDDGAGIALAAFILGIMLFVFCLQALFWIIKMFVQGVILLIKGRFLGFLYVAPLVMASITCSVLVGGAGLLYLNPDLALLPPQKEYNWAQSHVTKIVTFTKITEDHYVVHNNLRYNAVHVAPGISIDYDSVRHCEFEAQNNSIQPGGNENLRCDPLDPLDTRSRVCIGIWFGYGACIKESIVDGKDVIETVSP